VGRPRAATLAPVLIVSTVNVNGMRAAARKGFLPWLAGTEADIVCVQEVRAEPGQLPAQVREPEGWHAVFAPGSVPGRNGVAIYSRVPPVRSRIGFDSVEFADSGRYVEAEFPGVVVASLYLPSGDVGTPRQDEKERFMKCFLPYLVDLRSHAEAAGRDVLVCGDWNIAHREIDLKNWKGNRNSAGFLPSEREWLSRVFDESGYVDVVRRHYPEGPGPYTWWSYRGKAFDNDAGWRIDLVAGTERITSRSVSAVVEKAPSYDQRWSDHAPVTVSFDMPFDAP
jgi:exodeoxyribonuclease-3